MSVGVLLRLQDGRLFQSYEEIEASAIPVGGKVQPGDVKFVDRNEDGVIDSKDKFILGNAFPRLTFGFNYNVEWKDSISVCSGRVWASVT